MLAQDKNGFAGSLPWRGAAAAPASRTIHGSAPNTTRLPILVSGAARARAETRTNEKILITRSDLAQPNLPLQPLTDGHEGIPSTHRGGPSLPSPVPGS